MSSYGTGIIQREIEGSQVKIDGRDATISASVPKLTETCSTEKEKIYTNPTALLKEGALPSFSLVRFAKIKNFIDGVYAAIEGRVAEGGHRLSRTDFLNALVKTVHGDAESYISMAMRGQTKNEPSMTIPQGFYDWTPQLTKAYRQIKSIAKNPAFFAGKENDSEFNNKIMNELHQSIKINSLDAVYDNFIDLYSRMTGQSKGKDCLFPSANLPDQDFFEQLSFETQSDIPDGLGKALVKAIKQGKVNFVPNKDSGL